jgi:hypothetical protein
MTVSSEKESGRLDGEVVVAENVRQTCMGHVLANAPGRSRDWWTYVIAFRQNCRSAQGNFNAECSMKVLPLALAFLIHLELEFSTEASTFFSELLALLFYQLLLPVCETQCRFGAGASQCHLCFAARNVTRCCKQHTFASCRALCCQHSALLSLPHVASKYPHLLLQFITFCIGCDAFSSVTLLRSVTLGADVQGGVRRSALRGVDPVLGSSGQGCAHGAEALHQKQGKIEGGDRPPPLYINKQYRSDPLCLCLRVLRSRFCRGMAMTPSCLVIGCLLAENAARVVASTVECSLVLAITGSGIA